MSGGNEGLVHGERGAGSLEGDVPGALRKLGNSAQGADFQTATAPVIELNTEEAHCFSNVGEVDKVFATIPEGIFVGADVRVGHWTAEVARIDALGKGEVEKVFVVGLRMRF